MHAQRDGAERPQMRVLHDLEHALTRRMARKRVGSVSKAVEMDAAVHQQRKRKEPRRAQERGDAQRQAQRAPGDAEESLRDADQRKRA